MNMDNLNSLRECSQKLTALISRLEEIENFEKEVTTCHGEFCLKFTPTNSTKARLLTVFGNVSYVVVGNVKQDIENNIRNLKSKMKALIEEEWDD